MEPLRPTNLPKPGEIVRFDCRPAYNGDKPSAAESSATNSPVKLVQWNVERGYQLPRIIQELKELEADVIALQVCCSVPAPIITKMHWPCLP